MRYDLYVSISLNGLKVISMTYSLYLLVKARLGAYDMHVAISLKRSQSYLYDISIIHYLWTPKSLKWGIFTYLSGK